MAPCTRRTLLTAVAAAPALRLMADDRAAAATTPASGPASAVPESPSPRILVIDPAQEIGGLDSVAPDAVGVLPRLISAPSLSTAVGSGRTRVAVAGSVPFTFRSTPFVVGALPPAARPYAQSKPEPLVDPGLHDASGVRMFLWQGRQYDHPVAQSQYGLHLLESYRLTGTKTYLDRAAAQARRLGTRAVDRAGAWFYPYGFSINIHGSTDLFRAPWYSMMAQGQAMSLFVRLFEVTRDATWKNAADKTFASFLLPYAEGQPWGMYVKDELLRLEEYPSPTAPWGDQTYNGHVFSTFGLYDYYRLTGNADALSLLRGAMTTARDLLPQHRVANWRSKYCLRHGADAGHYHVIHIQQQQMLQAITRDEAFARNADVLYHDYPLPPTAPAPVRFAPGTHVGYRFSSTGAITARKTFVAARPSGAHAKDRQRVKGRSGLWYVITDGVFKGYLVQETAGHRTMLGIHAVLAYPVPRLAHVTVAQPAAVTVSSSGVVSSRATSYPVGTRIWIDARGVLNAVEHLRIAAGTYKGRWIRAASLALG